MKKNTYIILISCSIFSLPISAELNALSDLCSNGKFTKCITISKNKCITAESNSEKTCLKMHPINIDEEREESFETAKSYAQCYTNTFITNLNTDINNFEKCLTSSNYLKHVEEIMKNKHNAN